MVQQQRKTTKSNQITTDLSQRSHAAEDQLTFLEHIYELRARLFWVIASLVVASSVGFYFKDLLISFIKAPLSGERLIYLTPGGGFSFIFTVCLYFGLLLTIPVIMYQLYRFLQPVFGKASRMLIAAIIVVSSLLALAGALFGYFVAIPAAIEFLTTFAGDAVAPSLTAESYLGFVVAYMLGLAVLFQLPLLLYIIDYVRPFPPGGLWSSQRFVVAGAVIAAAVITPTPDIINQAIVAGPIILVYQLGAIAVYVRHKFLQRALRKAPLGLSEETSEVRTNKMQATELGEPAQRERNAPRLAVVTSAVTPVSNARPQAHIQKSPTMPSAQVQPVVRPTAHQSVDGFAPRTARSALKPVVPQRASAPRRLRSVDGMSFM